MLLSTGVGAVTAMVLLHTVCKHHGPRLIVYEVASLVLLVLGKRW